MQDLKQLNLSDLLENLVNQTLLHKQIILNGGTAEEFRTSKAILRELFEEIGSRKSDVIDNYEKKS